MSTFEEYRALNPFIPAFLKWTLPPPNLDTYIIANRDLRNLYIRIANRVDPDEAARLI